MLVSPATGPDVGDTCEMLGAAKALNESGMVYCCPSVETETAKSLAESSAGVTQVTVSEDGATVANTLVDTWDATNRQR